MLKNKQLCFMGQKANFLRAAAMASVIAISGCGGPFADYSNQDLRSEYNKCDYSKLTAAGAQRCNNIKKECESRKKDSGFRC